MGRTFLSDALDPVLWRSLNIVGTFVPSSSVSPALDRMMPDSKLAFGLMLKCKKKRPLFFTGAASGERELQRSQEVQQVLNLRWVELPEIVNHCIRFRTALPLAQACEVLASAVVARAGMRKNRLH